MSTMWKKGEPGQLSEYAKSIGVTELDAGTARGVYLTTADIKHIRSMLQRVNKLDELPGASGESLSPEAVQWNQSIIDYTKGVR